MSQFPLHTQILLEFIRKTETGKTGAESYNTIYGHNQHKLVTPVTKMTIAQIQKAQADWTKLYGSSATGAYQFMRATLRDLITELKLHTNAKLTPSLQDKLAVQLLKRRKFEQYLKGQITREQFGNELAKEWASFPVLTNVKGAHRNVSRGETYYSGDKLNKALVSPAKVEEVLSNVMREFEKYAGISKPVIEKPIQEKPKEETKTEAPSEGHKAFTAIAVLAILIIVAMAASFILS